MCRIYRTRGWIYMFCFIYISCGDMSYHALSKWSSTVTGLSKSEMYTKKWVCVFLLIYDFNTERFSKQKILKYGWILLILSNYFQKLYNSSLFLIYLMDINFHFISFSISAFLKWMTSIYRFNIQKIKSCNNVIYKTLFSLGGPFFPISDTQ